MSLNNEIMRTYFVREGAFCTWFRTAMNFGVLNFGHRNSVYLTDREQVCYGQN
jgi:hypothetical protein